MATQIKATVQRRAGHSIRKKESKLEYTYTPARERKLSPALTKGK